MQEVLIVSWIMCLSNSSAWTDNSQDISRLLSACWGSGQKYQLYWMEENEMDGSWRWSGSRYTQGSSKSCDRLKFHPVIDNNICTSNWTRGHKVDGRGRGERSEELWSIPCCLPLEKILVSVPASQVPEKNTVNVQHPRFVAKILALK